MNIKIDSWLQDAVLDVLRDHVSAQVRKKLVEEHGVAPATFVSTKARMEEASGLVCVEWSCWLRPPDPRSRVEEEVYVSPQNALRIFLGLATDPSLGVEGKP